MGCTKHKTDKKSSKNITKFDQFFTNYVIMVLGDCLKESSKSFSNNIGYDERKGLPISNQKTKTFKVGLYIRLSREDGDKEESSSITNQREILKRFVNENENFFIIKEYVDDGWTGTNFNRPSFKEMIKDIEKGIIDTVITKDLSRLGRDYIDTGYYLQRYFPEHRVRYIALLDNIDTMEDAGMSDIAPFKSIIND